MGVTPVPPPPRRRDPWEDHPEAIDPREGMGVVAWLVAAVAIAFGVLVLALIRGCR